MLPFMKNYYNGLIVIPVILAFRKHGVFDVLSQEKTITLKQLVKKTKSNEVYLRIALSVLESLRWIHRIPNTDKYLLSDDVDHSIFNMDDFTELLNFPMTEYLNNSNSTQSINRWIEYSKKKWGIQNSQLQVYLDGCLIVPLLQNLKKRNSIEDISGKSFLSELSLKARKEVTELLINKGWLLAEKKRGGLTDLGRKVFEYISDTGPVFESWMFEIEELIFGNSGSVSVSTDFTSLAFARNKLESDLETIFVSIFSDLPFDTQPKYIAIIGSKDDTMMRIIQEIILSKTARGRVQTLYPLQILRIDVENAGNPEKLMKYLSAHGLTDPEDILYVRESVTRTDQLKNEDLIINRFGLITIEIHGLEPSTIAQYLQQSDCLYFDFSRRFAQGYLEGADSFLLTNAQVGLFPHPETFSKFPPETSFTQITLNHFMRKNYSIRIARQSDLPKLLELEKLCWDADLAASGQTIARRINKYPEGQVVLEIDGVVKGAMYSQKIEHVDIVHKATSKTVESLHSDKGTNIQFLAINIMPDVQDQGLGDHMLEFMLQRSEVIEGIKSVVAVTRCRDYGRYPNVSKAEYIKMRTDTGWLIDPILRFHELHGAQIKGLVPGYRPKDNINEGNGVLVEYDINKRNGHNFNWDIIYELDEYIDFEQKDGNTRTHDNKINTTVLSLINSILGKEETDNSFDVNTPLMEAGMDSSDIFDLKEQLSQLYDISLGASFFFKYNTPAKIISFLLQHTNQGPQIEEKEVEDVQADENEDSDYRGIAIVGASCRLPGGIRTITELWSLLVRGEDKISQLPSERWEWPSSIDPASEHLGIDYGGFLDRLYEFDPFFFRIPKHTAEWMDPQQRMLLELGWECIEDSGYNAKDLWGSNTGVFIGASGSDYQRLTEGLQEVDESYAQGTAMSILPNRISYFFNFHGPSLLIDTACSSSLIAVHEAVKAIECGECEQALVGGIHLMCHPSNSVSYYKAGMLSKDGKCKAFANDADGYVRGEGGVVLLIKPLKKAVEDKDAIMAVIKGTATNHGGQAGGLTVPNPDIQASLVANALRSANILPQMVSYIEAHGTGTPLGDPIELDGLKNAFNHFPGNLCVENSCGIGSIKSNIGHLEAASGIVGLLKVVLSMQNQMIPSSINCKEVSTSLELEDSPFYIMRENMPWERKEGLKHLYAGVSNFGSGGANAHVVLEDYYSPNRESSPAEKPCYLIVLSGKTKEALNRRFLQLDNWIEQEGYHYPIQSISAALLLGRAHFKERAAFVVKDAVELKTKLAEVLNDGKTKQYICGTIAEGGNDESFERLAAQIVYDLGFSNPMLSTGKYRETMVELSNLYVKGCEFDGRPLFQNVLWRHVKLPYYPFASELFWLPTNRKIKKKGHDLSGMHLHPLIHQNISNMHEQLFRSSFKGEEFFLVDHMVDGQKVLPGVTYLEMALAATEISMEGTGKESNYSCLSEVNWIRTYSPENNQYDVRIKLLPTEDSNMSFEIFGNCPEHGPIIYCEGIVKNVGNVSPIVPELADLQSRCSKKVLSAEKCYEWLKDNGLSYGDRFRGIHSIYVGDEEVLAEISLSKQNGIEGEFRLVPGLIDSALQAVLIFNIEKDGTVINNPMLPYSLREMEVYEPCTSHMWAWVRHSGKKGGDKGETPLFDISLINDNGNLAVRLKELVFRRRGSDKSIESSLNNEPVVESQKLRIAQKSLLQAVQRSVTLKLAESLSVDVDSIDSEESFMDYGVDSITGIHLVKVINQTLSVQLRTTDLFDYSSVNKLSAYIIKKFSETLQPLADSNSFLPELLKIEEKDEKSKFRIRSSESKNVDSGKESIAIIGMSGRFAKSQDLQNLWEHLVSGDDLVEEITRWDLSKRYTEGGVDRKNYCNHGSFLEDVDCFDPMFFSISGVEASYMDPQQRVFLEESWKALEDAGYAGSNMDEKRCGVYVGCQEGDYHHLYGDHAPAQSMWGRASSIIPARIAYYLNLQGPAVTVDTACSSSLVAIHLACQSLWSKETEMALAGGVTIRTTPEFIMSAEKAGMLSPKGHCHAFDESADGFVFGEGVGVVVLKRLQDALADGDHIHGVIRGSGINQDGKTNGITAPSSNSQERLECQVYEDFHIDPGKIQVVEAHGTGTKLGDPIEFEALTRSFRKYTGETEYCAIGSIKTNLGHTVTAAGVAGVLKILLSLKHNQIPPSLHYRVENPNITFKGSPFYVNTRLKDWEIEEGNKRIAAVSSFGFSGTNAHLVIEEAPRRETAPAEKPGYLIVLSARTAVQLREQAKRLITYVKQESKISCANMSFTLLKGRKHWNHRMACVVRDREDLQQVLEDWLDQGEAANVYIGEIQDNAQPVQKEEALINRGNQCLRKCNQGCQTQEYLENLVVAAKLFTTGYELDFDELFRNEKYFRVPLPVYPFAKERYWVQEAVGKRDVSSRTYLETNEMLHPLLHRNTSTLSEQRFSSLFTGNEFFLRDHVVKGQRVLPGVAYLEMARAAIELSTELDEESATDVRLYDVVWLQPYVFEGHEIPLHIRLFNVETDKIGFDIYSEAPGGAPLVHCQGAARIVPTSNSWQLRDLAEARSRCSIRDMSSEQIYRNFEYSGLSYGKTFQGVQKLFVGREDVLAKLVFSKAGLASESGFRLHPSLLDSALQASTGFTGNSEGSSPMLPFVLEELEWLGPCESSMWVFMTASNMFDNTTVKTRKYDLELCNGEGRVCLRIKGLVLRQSEESGYKLEEISADENNDTGQAYTLVPVWDAVTFEKQPINTVQTVRKVMIGGTPEQQEEVRRNEPYIEILELGQHATVNEIVGRLEGEKSISRLMWVAPTEGLHTGRFENIIEDQGVGVVQLFRTVKALLQLGYESKELEWVVITTQSQQIQPEDAIHPTHASMHGFAGSMAKEYPDWKVWILDLEYGESWPAEEMDNLMKKETGLWGIRRGEWHRRHLVSVSSTIAGVQDRHVYRDAGVYVVIGGAGGIGEAWSESVIRKYGAQVIWIGRREESEEIRNKQERLGKLGPKPLYLKADATDAEELRQAYAEIRRNFGRVHGVVHSAIVMLDQSLALMDEERFQSSLAAKVDTSVRLAQVFGNEPLDFVLFFSSINSFLYNPGQSNYVSGCTFKDAFAQWLGQLWSCPVKVINWGFWGSVGIVSSKDYRKRMTQAGFGSIEPEEGMKALNELLTGTFQQTAFIKITKQRILDELEVHESLIQNAEAPSCLLEVSASTPDEREHVPFLASLIMEDILCKLLWGQMHAAGLFGKSSGTVEELRVQLGRQDHFYGKWLTESLSFLEKKEYLTFDGTTYWLGNRDVPDLNMIWKEWEEHKVSWMEDSDTRARTLLAEMTLRAIPDILAGAVQATEVIFPDGSIDLVEGIYKQNPTADFYNETLADTVEAYLRERIQMDKHTGIRILEVGAGTGGTTASVLARLGLYRKNIVEYTYTDMSKAFLMHAKDEFGSRHPYLSYQILNAEEAYDGQGIERGSYDLVIAANVLHATRNIRRTLGHAKAALKTNGLLILNEITENTIFNHVTFGLLEGWWLAEDTDLRLPGCPCLSSLSWKSVLEEKGWQSVRFPNSGPGREGQHVIVARSDGRIRVTKTNIGASFSLTGNELDAAKLVNCDTKSDAFYFENAKHILDKCRRYLIRLMAESLQLSEDSMDPLKSWEHYGIDSILIIQLTNELQKAFGVLSKTLLFEYQTIDQLASYLVQAKKDVLLEFFSKIETEIGHIASNKQDSFHSVVLPSKKATHRSRWFNSRAIGGMSGNPAVCNNKSQQVAIIGLAGRYPQAENMEEFWDILKQGRNVITEIPFERWNWKNYYDPEKGKEGSSYSKWGGFISDINRFDALFFQVSPAEAEQIDPQERQFLEVAYESIQDAGYTPSTLSNNKKVGVFVGIMNGYYPTGSRYWSIANRVSYSLDFQGPSIAVDTACSSSLTAIHLAVESLSNGGCDCAVAGGVSLILSPQHLIRLSELTMLSESNTCKSFGENANGFVDGEGVGAVVLKPLEKAIRDGDHIYGVIKGSTINAGGKTSGYTVPNPVAQSEVISDALNRAGVHPRMVSYIEAHGTGTALGDPIEIRGLSRSFEKDTLDKQFCALGSVKSNIGHSEGAAGIAGLTKILLQLKYKLLVPSLHSSRLNPYIDFDSSPFIVQQELSEWKRPMVELGGRIQEYPRIAGISSFGAGGANAHLIIEEFPSEKGNIENDLKESQESVLLVLSARNNEQLVQQARRLQHAIRIGDVTDQNLSDVAYTYQVGREAMDERLAIVAKSVSTLERLLLDWVEHREDGISLYQGNIKRNKELIYLVSGDETWSELVELWVEKKNLEKIAELWTKGFELNWERLHKERRRRVPLPTYPFGGNQYWCSVESSGFSPFKDDVLVNQSRNQVQEASDGMTDEMTVMNTGALYSHIQNIREMLPKRSFKKGIVEHHAILIPPVNDSYEKEWLKRIEVDFVQAVASCLNVHPSDLDPDTKINEYGFDRFLFEQLCNKISWQFGVVYRCALDHVNGFPSIRQMVALFVSEFRDQIVYPAEFVAFPAE